MNVFGGRDLEIGPTTRAALQALLRLLQHPEPRTPAEASRIRALLLQAGPDERAQWRHACLDLVAITAELDGPPPPNRRRR